MLFQEDRTPIVPKGKKNHGEWPENYFAEFDPAARKMILDKRREEEADETLECLEKLFALRYKQDKKGNYADQFLGQFLQLRITAENLDVMFSERKNRKAVRQCLEQLQLHAGSEIPEELIYQEMCQLTGLYIYSCSKDVNYTSMIWGFGKKSDEKISEKINLDLERIGEAIPKYLSMEEEYRVLKAAIMDTKKQYL